MLKPAAPFEYVSQSLPTLGGGTAVAAGAGASVATATAVAAGEVSGPDPAGDAVGASIPGRPGMGAHAANASAATSHSARTGSVLAFIAFLFSAPDYCRVIATFSRCSGVIR